MTMKEAVIRRYKVTNRQPQQVITLQEAKDYLKVDGTAEDAIISTILEAVVADAERALNYSLVAATIMEDLHITEDNQELIALAWGPVDTMVSIEDGESNTLGGYQVLTGQTGVIQMDGGWEAGHYTINYTVSPHPIKPNVKLAIMKMLAQAYDYRNDPVQAKPTASDYLLLKEEQNVFRS